MRVQSWLALLAQWIEHYIMLDNSSLKEEYSWDKPLQT